jgi:hypothetical protein
MSFQLYILCMGIIMIIFYGVMNYSPKNNK